ncbi:hypothetical protein GQ42DRAFT_162639 [Ramicandelaber brevisporus]|nr:hypothetical protein GQ42DRAFT_162639 [Ramicandelaber brevisporus]
MRSAIALPLVLAAAFCATVLADDSNIPLPSTVDPAKPDTVRAYFTSVSKAAIEAEATILPLVPSDKVAAVKKIMEDPFNAFASQVATETVSEKLAKIAATVAMAEAHLKRAATDPAGVASAIVSAIVARQNSTSRPSTSTGAISSSTSQSNVAASELTASVAQLTAGGMAGMAAFAALY